MIKSDKNFISAKFISAVSQRIAENKQVRRSLPVWGRVHIDRQLPFICVYRQRKNQGRTLSDGLVTGMASYLTAAENRKQQKQLSQLIKAISKTLVESFGSFLIVEVWVSETDKNKDISQEINAGFKVIRPKKTNIVSTIETLERSLKNIKLRKKGADVETVLTSKIAPKGLSPLISPAEAAEIGCFLVGIEVYPAYIGEEANQDFPIVFQRLKRSLSQALKNTFYEFISNNTPYRPPNYHSLGRRSVVKAVWEVDRQLAEISNDFDFLLQVTPRNNDAAWSAYRRSQFKKIPLFDYRPLSVDPTMAKRRLYRVPIERIEDPTLAQLFLEQQLELDRKFTMLIDRGTPRFLFGSLQLYGTVDESLVKIAKTILETIPPRRRDESQINSIDAKSFAERAKQELAFFKKTLPDISSKVFVREDITGLFVSQGNLLIGARAKIPAGRVDALIAHEVGTHVLTYINGRRQPLQQLYIGFSGYDELQEGLAVFSEYLVGGLTETRMRLLAARVIAAHRLINGASFSEVFHELNKDYGFEQRTSFNICSRTFRGGGMTKDAIYLRGLVKLVEYLKKGGELEPLYIGKISGDHVNIIKELLYRKVLQPIPLMPRYLGDPKTNIKLNNLKKDFTIYNLINRRKK